MYMVTSYASIFIIETENLIHAAYQCKATIMWYQTLVISLQYGIQYVLHTVWKSEYLSYHQSH